MEKILIYNAVPAYEQECLNIAEIQKRIEVLIKDFKERGLDRAYLILPKGAGELVSMLPEGITGIEAAEKAGLVYSNDSALRKITIGEKPIPSAWNEEIPSSVFLTDLDEERTIAIQLSSTGKKSICVSREITIAEAIEKAGWKGEIKAVYLGHPSGRVLLPNELDEMVHNSVKYMRIIGKNDCIVDELMKLGNLYRTETCGRCVFGHEGTAQIQMVMNDIVGKKGRSKDMDLLFGLSEIMKEQTVCEVCASLATTLMDIQSKFKDEINAHLVKKTCPAGVCAKFVTYHILADMCTGCTDCVDECEEEVILGKKKFVHVIDQDSCTQCGKCIEVCEEDAIVKAGTIKPRCPAKPIPCKR